MSRLQLGTALALVLALLCTAPSAQAQMTAEMANANSLGNAGVRGSTMLDLTMPSFNDPAAVDMLFQEGNTILSILEGLNEKGFHIEFKEKNFAPGMTLLSLPTATKIDDVLREILEPWAFQVYRSPFGKLIVKPEKKSATQLALETKAKQ
jgi:hypothetical protein